MKVLLRKNIRKLGAIGDIVEVKTGYARNYLIPQGLGTQPTQANIRRVEEEKARYLEEMARLRGELEARAKQLEGKEITISARANEQGHLYGSIGPAQIAAAMTEAGLFVEVEQVALDQPIRQLDKYDVTLEFSPEVKATVHVWIVPIREEGVEVQSSGESAETVQDAPAPSDAE
jgi:large subunit ribosomal protein L9